MGKSKKSKKKLNQREENGVWVDDEAEYEKELLNILQPLGVESYEQWDEIALEEAAEDWKVLKSEDAGYEEESWAMDAFENDLCSPATEFLLEHEGKYVVWQRGSYTYGYGRDYLLPEIFNDLESAEVAYARQIEGNTRPLEEQIKAVKNALSEYADDVYIKPRWDHTFRIYYNRLLIIDKLGSLSARKIKEAIEHLLQFEEKYNISFDEIYKTRREWNSNQRNYYLSWYREKHSTIPRSEESEANNWSRDSCYLHISSGLQNKTREPVIMLKTAVEKNPKWVLSKPAK